MAKDSYRLTRKLDDVVDAVPVAASNPRGQTRRRLIWLRLCVMVIAGVALVAPNRLLQAQVDSSTPHPPVVEYSHRRWTVDDGLPQNSVTCMIQARDGYIWLGTFGGLVRFDGHEFRSYVVATSEGLASNRIMSLLEDRAGRIWIGTDDGGVSRFDHGRFEKLSSDQLPKGVIWSMVESGDGSIWIGGHGLARYAEGRFESVAIGEGVPFRVNKLLVSESGRLWAATSIGLAWSDGQAFTLSGPDHAVPRGAVWSLVEVAGDQLWISTVHGLGRYDDGRFRARDDGSLVEGGPSWTLAMDEGPDGRIWVAGDTGIFWLDVFDRPVLTRAIPGIHDDTSVRSILVDREGSVWLGTDGRGLLRVRPTRFQRYGPEHGLKGSILDLESDGQGGAWCFRLRRCLEHVTADGKTTTTVRDELMNEIAAGRAGALWIAEQNRVQRIGGAGPAELPIKGATAMLEGDDGTLWAGTKDGVFACRDGKVERHELELGGEAVVRLALAPDGALWFITERVVGRLKEGKAELLEKQLPSSRLRAVYVDGGGITWVSSYGGGLLRIEGERVCQYTKADGLPDDHLGRIVEDRKGRLWINSNQGIFCVDGRELADFANGRIDRVVTRSLATPEGNGRNGFLSPDGRLWFPTVEGIVVVDAAARFNEVPPKVSLEQILADEVEREPTELVEIEPGRGDLEISYAGLSFVRPAEVEFRYRLVGRDPEWHDVGTRRRAFFTNLDPGDYRFEVQARNEDGVWSESPAILHLRLHPRFYQTAWFIALISGLGGCSILWMHRVRVSRIESRRRDAETKLSTERALLAAEQEARRLEAQLRESHKMEAVGRLAGGICHDFNNILTALYGHTALLREGLGNDVDPGLESSLTQIETAGHRIGDLTNQLLTFSRRRVLKLAVLDPEVVIEELEPMLQRLVRANIDCRFELDAAGARVEMDRGQLEQVIVNLFVNAVQSMPTGGELSITCTQAFLGDADASRPPDAKAGNHVVLKVSDTGIGIEPETLDHIFEPFFTTRGESGGTGLGLANVHGIVTQAGGHLRVESTAGVGTVFEVFLPATANSERSAVSPPSSPGEPSDRQTILVCDDDENIVRIIEAALRGGGYRVLTTSSAREILELAETLQDPVHLLITDVVMPKMNGRALAEEFTLHRPECAVLFISGYPADVTVDRDSLDVKVDYLEKPFTPTTILRRVRKLLTPADTAVDREDESGAEG